MIYLLLNLVVSVGMRWLERASAVPGYIGSKRS